jgi:hypothetical protein
MVSGGEEDMTEHKQTARGNEHLATAVFRAPNTFYSTNYSEFEAIGETRRPAGTSITAALSFIYH